MFKQYIIRFPLSSFIVITYIISWVFLYPCYQLILNDPDQNIPPLAFIGMIGAYGPVIGAIIVTYYTEGKKGLRSLWQSVKKWKVSFKWYLFIFLFPLIIYFSSTLLSKLFGYQIDQLNFVTGIKSIPFWVLVALPFGPMGEELGWRGFLLPKLLEKYSILKSSVLVGMAWGIWHLASFTFPGAAIPSFMEVSIFSISVFILYTIASSLIFTFVFFKTKGSVFIAILLHAFFNASANVVGATFGEISDNQHNIAIYCVSILITGIIGFVLLKNIRRVAE